jgi:hypothetical protein
MGYLKNDTCTAEIGGRLRLGILPVDWDLKEDSH